MKYDYAFKLNAVEMYRSGQWISTPEGIGQKNFRKTVGLVFLLLFHVFTTGKLMDDDKAYPLAPFLTAGLIVGYLIYL